MCESQENISVRTRKVIDQYNKNRYNKFQSEEKKMIKYYKLFDMLTRRGMKKTDLDLSSKTIAKLSKGANLNTDVIDKICMQLNCQPADIMEYVPNEQERSSLDYMPGIKLSSIKKHIAIPLNAEWEEQMTEEVIEQFWNRYEIYHNAISKEMFVEILYTCAYMGKGKQLRFDEDKMIMLIKRYADMSKVEL